MSIYAIYGGTTEQQFATNRGHGDVVRWVQSLPSVEYAERLTHLIDWGWVNEIANLKADIDEAMRHHPPPMSVKRTLDAFVLHLDETDAESVMLTNGLSSDETDGDGEWWIGGKKVI